MCATAWYNSLTNSIIATVLIYLVTLSEESNDITIQSFIVDRFQQEAYRKAATILNYPTTRCCLRHYCVSWWSLLSKLTSNRLLQLDARRAFLQSNTPTLMSMLMAVNWILSNLRPFTMCYSSSSMQGGKASVRSVSSMRTVQLTTHITSNNCDSINTPDRLRNFTCSTMIAKLLRWDTLISDHWQVSLHQEYSTI